MINVRITMLEDKSIRVESTLTITRMDEIGGTHQATDVRNAIIKQIQNIVSASRAVDMSFEITEGEHYVSSNHTRSNTEDTSIHPD